MLKTAHWNIHFTGEDADKINVYELIKDLENRVDITSSVSNIYYTIDKS